VKSERVFLAGATGVIGIRLTALLVGAGHVVAGMTRSADKAGELRALGVVPVVCDVFDEEALRAAVVEFRPTVVMHQLTDLPDEHGRLAEFYRANARIRSEGTANLVRAANEVDARVVAQSIAWAASDSVLEHERMVLAAEGTVIRYGQFYGPGTYFELEPPPAPRIHIDEAASRTVELLNAGPGIVNVTEDA
jgi:uncharacterized protein YbjT (DUF2867 family)